MLAKHTSSATETKQIQCSTHWGLLCIGCSLLFLVAACQPIQRPSKITQLPNSRSPNLFNIGGRNLALFCEGAGSPTVILEAGLAGDHTTWELVQPQAAKLSRTCSYDRAGMGESDPASTPRTSADVVNDLHRLLEVAGEKRPYLLVGHSFGGLHTRLFAATYPDEVIGMILVDAVHEDWWRKGAALLPAATANEDPAIAELRRYFTSDGGSPNENSEGIDIAATAEQVRKGGRFGDKPLVVLVAGIPDVLPPNLPEQLQLALVKLLQQDLPQQFVHLSTNSIKVDVPNSGHDIPRQRPDIVVVAIKTLVEINQSGSK
ncbi:MAG: alpha/beta hydrolase [Caldilineaceae bacterium]